MLKVIHLAQALPGEILAQYSGDAVQEENREIHNKNDQYDDPHMAVVQAYALQVFAVCPCDGNKKYQHKNGCEDVVACTYVFHTNKNRLRS